MLFDLGGTLFSYAAREQMGSAATLALVRLGLDPATPEVEAARRQAYAAVAREYASRRSFLHKDLFRERVARTALLLGVTAPADVLDRFTTENIAAILEHMTAKPEAAPTLRALRARGLYVGVVSNADDEWLEPALRRAGMVDLVP